MGPLNKTKKKNQKPPPPPPPPVNFFFDVHVDLYQQKNLLFICVSNSLVTRLKYRDGELQSTKREAGHGLGLPAIRRIAEQYSGEVKIEAGGDAFSLRVMLLQ
jgi:hypothetical protein